MPSKEEYNDLFVRTEGPHDPIRYQCDICGQIAMGDKAEFYNPEAEEDTKDLCSDCCNKLYVCGTCKHWSLGLDEVDIDEEIYYCYYTANDQLVIDENKGHRDEDSRCAEHWEQKFPFDFEKAKKLCLKLTDMPQDDDEYDQDDDQKKGS